MNYNHVKRAGDFTIASVAAIMLTPPALFVALVIKLESNGPVLFVQERTGLDGKPFMMYKFRSMSCDNDVLDASCANRLTRVGKILRKTSLDELPQIINVLRGDMSIIGPRPWITDYHKYMNPTQRRRNSVRPGITGRAQAYGRNGLPIDQKIQHDLDYVKNVSFREDVRIIAQTCKTVFDKSVAEIEKLGIHNELQSLKLQNNFLGEGVFAEKLETSAPSRPTDRISRRSNAKLDTTSSKKVTEAYNSKVELVSIVVPVYNAARFLRDTIASVQAQTYQNWDLIFVDDCSSDDSVSVIQESMSHDERIRLFINKQNSHAALTRNRGIDEATGRFIAFLDADDLWEPAKLEKQVAFMNRMDCEFTFTSYEFANTSGQPNGKKVHVPSSMNYKDALKNTTIFTSTVMFDMTKLSKNQIHMPNVKSEDSATWWKVLKNIECAYGLDEILSYYRRSDNSLSSNKLESVRRTWNLYRRVERLSLAYSTYNFVHYIINATLRRM